MIQLLHDIKFDWLGNRKIFIAISIVFMLAGLSSAVIRQLRPDGTDAFNLGVDFKGGTVLTVKFKQPPSADALRSAMNKAGIAEPIIQPSVDKPDEFLIKLALEQTTATTTSPTETKPDTTGKEQAQDSTNANKAQVNPAAIKAKQALDTFGKEAQTKTLAEDPSAAYKIVGTDAVGPIAGEQLRNQAIAVTLAACVGILLYIAFRFEWTYGAGAVIAVFHDVLVTIGVFSIFQWEINLTVIAAILTIIGFSVNDSIVIFDRIRENLKLHRRESLYDITNDSINQTLSRTIITSGLVILSTLALVLFGGEVLQSFSRALLVGFIFGTYSTIAIASPIMVWWQQRLDAASKKEFVPSGSPRGTTTRNPQRRARAARTVGK
jgi:preprotein translocase subunit SecF